MLRLLKHPAFNFAPVIRSLTKNNKIMDGIFFLFMTVVAAGSLLGDYLKEVESTKENSNPVKL